MHFSAIETNREIHKRLNLHFDFIRKKRVWMWAGFPIFPGQNNLSEIVRAIPLNFPLQYSRPVSAE